MASERSPLLTAHRSESSPAQSQDGPQQVRDTSPPSSSPDPESHPIVDSKDQKASSRDVLTVIPLLLLGVFVCNGDTSLVLATNGAIASEFKDLDHSGWLLTSFMLAMCATQPLYGKLSDVYGRKLVLSVAYILFIVGCLISGIGSTMNEVICGRVMSGAGGSGMTALVSIIIADMVPLREVAAWRSYVNIAATMGRSLGGPVGGYLTDSFGWRWSFYGQCPPVLLALALVLWRLPSSSSKKATGSVDSSSPPGKGSKLARIDFLGALFLACSIVSLLLVLDLASRSVPVPHIAALVVLGVTLFGCFIWVEKRWALLLQIAGQSGVMFSIPIYFQITESDTVTNAGARLVPAVVGNAVGGLLVGFLIQRTGKYKILSILGPVSSSIGFLLLFLRWNGKTNIAELMYSVPGGFGTGITQSTTFVQLTAGVDPSMMAIAGTSLYLSQNLGIVSGFSLTSTVLQSTLRSRLAQSLHEFPNKDEIIERSISNLHFVQSLEGKVKKLVVDAYVTGLTCTHALSLTCSLLAFAVALFIREHRM